MTRTTQQQFMTLLEKAAVDFDRDLVIDREYDNVGTVSFLRKDTMEVLFDFHFNFQAGTTSFERLPKSPAQIERGDTRESDYMRNSDLPSALARVRGRLQEQAEEDQHVEVLDKLESLVRDHGLEIDFMEDGRCMTTVDYAGEADFADLAPSIGLEVRLVEEHGPGGGWPVYEVVAEPKALLDWLVDYGAD